MNGITNIVLLLVLVVLLVVVLVVLLVVLLVVVLLVVLLVVVLVVLLVMLVVVLVVVLLVVVVVVVLLVVVNTRGPLMKKQSVNMHTKQFLYHEDSKTFISEASALEVPPGQWPTIVYLTSGRTGVVKPFFFDKVHKNAEQEVTHVTYRAGTLRMTIFND